MELIVIGDSKVKIMLSQKDMIKYSLSPEELDYEKAETRAVLHNILEDVKHRTGFETAGSKLSFQVFPCRKGGCEIFVSKIGVKENPAPALDSAEGGIHINAIFRFLSLAPLLSVLQTLSRRTYQGRSSVYYDESCYYLVLENVNGTDFIGEYAERLNNKNYIYHILEHCERLCINEAVEKLSPLY